MKIQRTNFGKRRILSKIAILDIASNKTIYEVFSEDKNGEFWTDFNFHSIFDIRLKYMGITAQDKDS